MAKRRSNSLPGLMVHLATTYRQRHPIRTLTVAYMALGGIGLAGAAFMMPSNAPEVEPLQAVMAVDHAITACDGPEGTWEGYQHLDDNKYKFTMEVRRGSDSNELAGSITSHYWQGAAASLAPSNHRNHTVHMDSSGHVDGRTMVFGGDNWSAIGSNARRTGYVPDRFTGQLSTDGQEFHAVNDDGYNAPTVVVFQHTGCTR